MPAPEAPPAATLPGGAAARAATGIMLLRGWRRLGLRFLAGALGALAMPPFGVLPALVVSLVVAVWLVDGAAGSRGTRSARLRPCALVGWAWGFGYCVAGLWWLGSAFLVEADEFLWALPLGVVGLPAGARAVLRRGLRRRAAALGPRRRPASPASPSGSAGRRMAARARLHRLSLEHPRHGARRRTSG